MGKTWAKRSNCRRITRAKPQLQKWGEVIVNLAWLVNILDGWLMKRFKVTGLLSAILLVAATGPSQAITYGSEINNASSSYPSVVSIWTNNTGYNYKSFLCTGKCKDGTYSFAATHRGMCSGHAGVLEFYS